MRTRLLQLVSAALLLAPALCALPGCEITNFGGFSPDQAEPAEADWTTTPPISAPSVDLIWERARLVLAGEGYRPDPTRTNYEQGRIVTEWIVLLAPNRFEGKRRRAYVEILPAGTEKQWTVRVSVLKQRNADIDQPLNPAKGEWEPESVDENRTALLAWKMHRAFQKDDAADSPNASR